MDAVPFAPRMLVRLYGAGLAVIVEARHASRRSHDRDGVRRSLGARQWFDASSTVLRSSGPLSHRRCPSRAAAPLGASVTDRSAPNRASIAVHTLRDGFGRWTKLRDACAATRSLEGLRQRSTPQGAADLRRGDEQRTSHARGGIASSCAWRSSSVGAIADASEPRRDLRRAPRRSRPRAARARAFCHPPPSHARVRDGHRARHARAHREDPYSVSLRTKHRP